MDYNGADRHGEHAYAAFSPAIHIALAGDGPAGRDPVLGKETQHLRTHEFLCGVGVEVRDRTVSGMFSDILFTDWYRVNVAFGLLEVHRYETCVVVDVDGEVNIPVGERLREWACVVGADAVAKLGARRSPGVPLYVLSRVRLCLHSRLRAHGACIPCNQQDLLTCDALDCFGVGHDVADMEQVLGRAVPCACMP